MSDASPNNPSGFLQWLRSLEPKLPNAARNWWGRRSDDTKNHLALTSKNAAGIVAGDVAGIAAGVASIGIMDRFFPGMKETFRQWLKSVVVKPNLSLFRALLKTSLRETVETDEKIAAIEKEALSKEIQEEIQANTPEEVLRIRQRNEAERDEREADVISRDVSNIAIGFGSGFVADWLAHRESDKLLGVKNDPKVLATSKIFGRAAAVGAFYVVNSPLHTPTSKVVSMVSKVLQHCGMSDQQADSAAHYLVVLEFPEKIASFITELAVLHFGQRHFAMRP